VGIVGLLKKNTQTRGITKEQHITQSCFIGGNWVGLLKNTLTHGITKEQHITQPCFIGGIVGLLKKYSNMESQRAAHHFNPAL
jgi:hypothetical protein